MVVGLAMALGLALVDPPSATATSITTSAKKAFVASMVGPAQKAQRQTGVPASVSIAQAIDESNWGTSKQAKNAKNYFNTRCSAAMTAAQFAKLADAQVGKAYVLGAEVAITNANPTKFDCSELVEWLFGRSGNKITDLAAAQYNATKAVGKNASPKVGDLVFLRNNPARSNGIGHVAVLTKKLANGDWRIIEAKGRAYGVVRTTLSFWKTRKYYAGLRRYAPLVFAGTDGVTASAASLYQSGCVTISSVKYSKFASINDSFAAHATAVMEDSAYAAVRSVLTSVPKYVTEIAKVERPKEASAYATRINKLIAEYNLLEYDVLPFTLVMLSGHNGAKVTAAQHLLTGAGYAVKVTGKYDSATISAVKKFQKAKKLVVDGEAGPITLGALVGKLESGAKGNLVTALHTLLNANGHNLSGSTFNAATKKAVEAFQAAVGRPATGTVDNNTWIALFMTLDPAPIPKVTGKAVVGQTLTAAPGTWGPKPVTLAYQWYRGATAIKGATKKTYQLQVEDAGFAMQVLVTGTKAKHTTTNRLSAATATVPLLKLTGTPVPKITGKAEVGQTLTAAPGTWAPKPVTLTYQWYRGKTAIKDATKSTYQVQAEDAGTTLKVAVTGAKVGYAKVTKESAVTSSVPLVLTTATPKIVGEAAVGQTLTADPGKWGPAKVKLTYQWYRGATAIKGATKPTYTLLPADAGADIKVTVTGTLAGYTTVSLTSKPTKAVAVGDLTPKTVKIRGTARVGEKLTAIRGTWGPDSVKYSFQWYRGSSAIKGATGKSYILQAADRGAEVKVKVTGSLAGHGKASKTSEPTTAVAKGKLITKAVSIKGTAKVGNTLTAVRGIWGPSPVKYVYQWYRGSSAIKGATTKSHKVVAADRGKTIAVKVRVSKSGYTAVEKQASVKVAK